LAWLVTHRLPIKEAAKAFTLYERHEENILKVILDAAVWE
jgi:threonine dehydrogenase-like Zn-dependent dehydrogenase